MARIDDAVRRILTMKFELGLFERPFADPPIAASIGSAAQRTASLARQAVRESQVLLDEPRGTLPLAQSDAGSSWPARRRTTSASSRGGWTISWQGSSGRPTEGTTVLDAVRRR